MKILITGGAGFIGSHTADALLKQGHQVRLLDVLRPPVHPKPKWPSYIASEAEKIIGDVRKKADLIKALRGIDAVFHLAAYQDYLPDFSTFYDINCKGTALLFEVAVEKKLPLRRIILASSQAVYGEGPYQCQKHGQAFPSQRREEELKLGQWDLTCPLCSGLLKKMWAKEEDQLRPHNAYAMSKRAQEELALNLGKRYGLPTVALRYSIVQGARQSPFNPYSGALRIFATSLLSGRKPVIYEDGEQQRDFVNIKDVVAANLMALMDQRMIGEVFNVGGGKAITVNQLYHALFPDTSKVSRSKSYRVGDTRHALSDISKLVKLGWQSHYTVKDSVDEYLQWLSGANLTESVNSLSAKTLQRLGVVRVV